MRSIFIFIALALCGLLPACADEIDCTGDYLFQAWSETSFTSADGGVTIPDAGPADGGAPPSNYLDLTLAHYGADQSFYMFGCSYYIDIEADSSGESGTFSFSNPSPASASCISYENTETFSLTCSSLTVSGPRGIYIYSPPQ